jgi:proline iminopeptidase
MTEEVVRELYPPIEPYWSGYLPVAASHTLYLETSGNPQGFPVVFLHGGPGGGGYSDQRRFFDPAFYRIILFDQRGCGLSLPRGETAENTTPDLVADLEKIRAFLKIERWLVFGPSWGSTLALAYAEKHPAAVAGLIVAGIFLGRQQDLAWSYEFGANCLYPDLWEKFIAPIPLDERGDLVAAYGRRLVDPDPLVRRAAAVAWEAWGSGLLRLQTDPNRMVRPIDPLWAEPAARVELHYFTHGCFLTPNQLLDNVGALAKIPGAIVQGRYDLICPVGAAWELHRAWPAAQFNIVTAAGHTTSEKGTTDLLIKTTDRFRVILTPRRRVRDFFSGLGNLLAKMDE